METLGISEGITEGIPDYDGFPSKDYLAPGFILPYSASRGCYWNRCSFCPEQAEGNPYRPVAPPRAARHLQVLSEKTMPVLIHLLDNALSPALLEEFTASPPGAPWYGFARITPHLADPDFCRALKTSGCLMLKLGLESGDQRVLDRLHKGIEIETAGRALKALREAGIATYVYLLFGTAAETEEAAQNTLDFVSAHSREIGFLNVALFNLPLWGPEVESLRTTPFYDGDLSLYQNFEHPGGWHRHRVRRFLDTQFKRHPAVAPILRRDPPIFTSNHAPFFLS